jgi:hypothetical protein
MSRYEFHKGILFEVPRINDETIEEQCKRLLNDVKLKDYYNTYVEMLDGETDYIIFNNIVYDYKDEELDPSEHFVAVKGDDGTIGFSVAYYNGGCGFKEAIEYALETIK